MESEQHDRIPNTIEVPAPGGWPMITALGLTMVFAGLVTSAVVSAVGAILIISGAIGWFGEVFPEEQRERWRLSRRPWPWLSLPVRAAVARIEVGEEGHRAVLPLGDLSVLSRDQRRDCGRLCDGGAGRHFRSVAAWQPLVPINILAATAMPSMATL